LTFNTKNDLVDGVKSILDQRLLVIHIVSNTRIAIIAIDTLLKVI